MCRSRVSYVWFSIFAKQCDLLREFSVSNVKVHLNVES